MTEKQMLTFLERKEKEIGVLALSVALGHQSQHTVKMWMKAKSIPKCRQMKVYAYIKKELK